MRHPGPFFNETLTYLQRKFRPRKRIAGVLLDLFYFIALDVLVILFMVHSSQELRLRVPAIPIELPAVAEAHAVALDRRVLTVSREGILFFANERVSLADIDRRFKQMANNHPEMTLIIAADKRVAHGDLLDLMNKALRAGIPKVALAGRVRSTDTDRGAGR